MISRIKDILPKVKQDHPDVDEKLLESIIDQYFRLGAEQMKNPTKNELAFPWITLRLCSDRIERDIGILNSLLKNPKDRSEEVLQKVTDKKKWLENLWEIYTNTPGFKSSNTLEFYKSIPKTDPILTEQIQKRYKI